MLRRLEEDRFGWLRRQQAVVKLTTEELYWFRESIDIEAVRLHPLRQYRQAS